MRGRRRRARRWRAAAHPCGSGGGGGGAAGGLAARAAAARDGRAWRDPGREAVPGSRWGGVRCAAMRAGGVRPVRCGPVRAVRCRAVRGRPIRDTAVRSGADRHAAVEFGEQPAAQGRPDRGRERVGRRAARSPAPHAAGRVRRGRRSCGGAGGRLPPADPRRVAAGVPVPAGSGWERRIGRSAHECPPVADRRTDLVRSNGGLRQGGAAPRRRSPDRVVTRSGRRPCRF